MGKLSHDPYLHHFSHPHSLELTDPQTITAPCSACRLPSQGGAWMYSCKVCHFALHVSCTQMPQLITHPSHPAHPLTLLPTPAYGGLFSCDGCRQTGNGFSYHCSKCDFDVHALCATKPLTISHMSHPQHQINLTFDPPYETQGFSCDICRRIGMKQWLYRCAPCGFDAHMDCVGAVHQQQAHLHPYNSFPVAHTNNSHPLQHYSSFPGTTNTTTAQAINGPGGGIFGPNSPSGNFGPNGPNNPNGQVGPVGSKAPGNALMTAIVKGFVEGAAQQVGQTFVQGVMGGDGGGANGSGGDPSGGDASSSGVFGGGESEAQC